MVQYFLLYRLFEQQTLKINEMRQNLEEDHNLKRKTMEKATKDVNLQLVNNENLISFDFLLDFPFDFSFDF